MAAISAIAKGNDRLLADDSRRDPWGTKGLGVLMAYVVGGPVFGALE